MSYNKDFRTDIYIIINYLPKSIEIEPAPILFNNTTDWEKFGKAGKGY